MVTGVLKETAKEGEVMIMCDDLGTIAARINSSSFTCGSVSASFQCDSLHWRDGRVDCVVMVMGGTEGRKGGVDIRSVSHN